ncbi:hypothetical protein CRE_24388 [Caenorhabditis remanei]|uniref:SWIM-type domain-containing protein n=1 Tax=Caenorhabditis remanei TaxID=31234 RepID=E3MFQ6_CAERE|nr:hypothetical protein CRE_24388 [Caenorhabditis remanei]
MTNHQSNKECMSDMNEVYVSSRLNLVKHFHEEHRAPHEVEDKEFDSVADFEEWLSKKQEETGTTLVTQTARDEGSRNTSYMICKHEGTYVRSGTKKYGHDTKKQTGDALCTAYLKGDLLGETMQSLNEVLREPRQEKVMHRLLSMLTRLDQANQKGADEFSAYFRTYYYERIDEWAASTRGNISSHSSMYAEAWHSVLKKEIIVTKRSIRCDLLISHLLAASDWVIKLKNQQKQRKLYSACPRKGQNRSTCRLFRETEGNYLVDQRSEDTYIVTKIADMKEYTVRDYKECICDTHENTHCDYCGACGYRFDCDCLFSRAGVACKHIHGILKFAASQQTSCELDDHGISSPRPSTSSSRYPSVNLNNSVLDFTRKEKDEHDDKITKRMDRLSTRDPEIPHDADEMEFESTTTEWKRCNKCKQPAHFSCTLNNKKCACSDHSYFELYPDNYLEVMDSDENSEYLFKPVF